MALELTLVDAFADRPFAGNPAAVAVMAAFPPAPTMQAVAAELHVPETAFVVPRADGAFDLRWFSPSVEVDLCGHATLAAAHVLGGAPVFHSRSGLLRCRPAGSGIELAFPADQARPEPAPDLGVDGVVGYGVGRHFALAECASAALVRDLVPDLARLAAIGTLGVIVTAPGDRVGVDMVSRVFCPNAGIPEDPVTGSAHCLLAGWWGERLGRTELVGEQASRRGGTVRMRREGPTVVLGGSAVTVGSIRLTAEVVAAADLPAGGSGAQVEV